MMSRIYLVIVLLILLAAAIGVLVFMQSNTSLPFSVTNQSQPSTSPYPNIESLLKPQEASPSAQQVEEYVTAVEKFAEEGDLVTLANDCLAEPKILKAKNPQEITIKNNGNSIATISALLKKLTSLPDKTIVVSLDPGIYSLSCQTGINTANKTAALILVPIGEPLQTNRESQIQQRAQAASEVILGAKCISTPSVLKTKAGEALKFKNNTKEEIRLFFPMTNIESSKGYFVLQAGRSTVVSLDFKPGVFSYTCHTPKDSNTYSKDILFE